MAKQATLPTTKVLRPEPFSYALIALFSLLLIPLHYTYWLSDNGRPKIYDLQQQIAQLERHNEQARSHNTKLRAEIDSLKKDHKAIEEIARYQFGMIKREGEKLYRFTTSQ